MVNYRIIFKDLFLDIFWEVVYFPLWWYSRGLKKAALFCWQQVREGWRALALSILLINFLKPMYGQRGFSAYVLTTMVRVWQVCWRFTVMAAWLVIWSAVLSGWLALPIWTVWQLII